MAEQSIVVQKFSEHIGKGCPHCKRGIEVGQTIVLCPRCKTVHHENCWYDRGGCGKLGCRGVASARPQTAQSSLAQAAQTRAAAGEADAAAGEAGQAPQTAPAQAQVPVAAIVGVIAVLLILAAIWLLR